MCAPTTFSSEELRYPQRWGPKTVTGRILEAALPAVLVLSLFAGPSGAQDVDFGATDPADPRLNQGPKEPAVGMNGMVSTQLMSSTLAALDVLESGGNAVDAALTALFVQQVHDYHMVFLFGSMSALVYDAESDEVYALSAVGARPLAERVERGDPELVSIGGTVRGAAALSERFGSRPWSSYFGPAVAAAEQGAIVTSFMYGLNFALFDFGFLGDLRDNEEARNFYMPDGHLVGVGQRWRMPALAETLRRLRDEGADYMYEGAWARKFVDAANARGAGVTLADLAEYEAQWLDPVRFEYRGHTIYGSPPPDTGGLEVGVNLNVLEHFDLASKGHYTKSPETLEILARTFDRSRDEVARYVRDPLSWKVPVDTLLSDDYGKLGAALVRGSLPRVKLSARKDDPASSDEPSALALGGRSLASQRDRAEQFELGSDHIVVADRYGNWVTLLHTIHGGAPGVFVDGVRATGSQAAARAVGKGRRIVLPITSILVTRDGRPKHAMGTPGNPPQPVTEVLLNLYEFGMNPREAVAAPRFWAFGDNETIQMETRLEDGVQAGLEDRGLRIEDLGDFNYHTGSMQVVWRDGDGRLHGISDSRRLGFAKGH